MKKRNRHTESQKESMRPHTRQREQPSRINPLTGYNNRSDGGSQRYLAKHQEMDKISTAILCSKTYFRAQQQLAVGSTARHPMVGNHPLTTVHYGRHAVSLVRSIAFRVTSELHV